MPADSARAALERIQNERVDAIVSDVAMAGQDGLGFIRDVRQLPDPDKRHVPAVALTAMAGADDRDIAIRAGFHKHVAKPVTATELVTCIVAAIDAARR